MENLDKKIAELGVKKRYPRDAFLFLAGEKAQGFYYIIRGRVRVFQMARGGKEVEIIRLQSGEFFAEAIAFTGEKLPAFARAVEETEVLFFEVQTVLKKIAKDPGLARFFLILLARKCLVLSARIETLSLRTVGERLVQYLLSFCSGEQSCLIELPLKKAELAKLLGTISETLSRNLHKLAIQGLIKVEGRRIWVMDCSNLRQKLSA
ncbi:MAG: Crp/Fnr family transcriptional regulator [Acidobacteriota bacterium]